MMVLLTSVPFIPFAYRLRCRWARSWHTANVLQARSLFQFCDGLTKLVDRRQHVKELVFVGYSSDAMLNAFVS